jgi:hypothetical protein
MKTQGWDGLPVVSTITRILERLISATALNLERPGKGYYRKPGSRTGMGESICLGLLTQECLRPLGRGGQGSQYRAEPQTS